MVTLREEIMRLRGRRGVWGADLTEIMGGELARRAGLTGTEDTVRTRERIIGVLTDLAEDLPQDLALVFLGFLAVHEKARHPTLSARVEWLSDQFPRHVSTRTLWRWFDRALDHIGDDERAVSDGGFAPPGWYLASLDTTLDLTGDTPVATERRRVVSTREGLDRTVVSFHVPRSTTDRKKPHGLLVEVLGGAVEAEPEQVGDEYFRHHVRFPRPLTRGEHHELVVRVRIPRGQPMRPEYVFRPLRRCDRFDLCVRFGDAVPARVRRVDGVPPGARPGRDAAPLLDSGELRMGFGPLRPGLGYGAVWD